MAKRNLSTRVYIKHNANYYVTLPERKWIRLGVSESEIYAALSKIKAIDAGKLKWPPLSEQIICSCLNQTATTDE
jgi:hypothetical protein